MAQLSGPDARFRSRRLSTAALQLITATTRSATKRDPTTREDRSAQSGRSDGAAGPRVEDTPGAADDKHSQDAWAELVEAGIADAPGALSPPWAALFDEASRGEIALRLVTRSGQAGMSSTVTITPGAALSISERRRLRVTETEIEVEAVEDAVELAVFDPGSLWPAVQRLLPPSPAVRADGSRRSALTERTVGIVQDRRGAGAPPRVEMPEAVLAELAASDVEVSLTMHVDRGVDQVGVVPVPPPEAHERERRGQQAAVREVVHRGQQLLLGEVAGHAEEHGDGPGERPAVRCRWPARRPTSGPRWTSPRPARTTRWA